MIRLGKFSNAFVDFLGNIFGKNSNGKIEPMTLQQYISEYESNRLSVDTYAMFTAIGMLSDLMANCEYKVIVHGKEQHNATWAKLNYKPNLNQTATEFWQEFYRKLLFNGDVLAFETYGGDQWIIADSFNISDYEVREKYFTDVSRGDFQARGTFPMSQVFYIKYPNENAEALKNGLLSRYDSLVTSATESYEIGTGNKAFVNINGAFQGNNKDQKAHIEYLNEHFKEFFTRKNAVMPLFAGMQATFANSSTSGKSTVDDITKLVSDSLSRAAQAFKISPALLTGDIAGIKDAIDFTLTSAVDPLANAVSKQLTVKLFTVNEIASNSRIVVDTSNVKHVDIFDISTSVDKLISSGFMNIDELRPFAGLEPTGLPEHQKYYITKNYSDINAGSAGGDA